MYIRDLLCHELVDKETEVPRTFVTTTMRRSNEDDLVTNPQRPKKDVFIHRLTIGPWA